MLDDPWHCVACVQQCCRSRGASPYLKFWKIIQPFYQPVRADYAKHITTSLLRFFRLSYCPVQCKWWLVAARSNERSALLGVALLYYTCLYSRSRPLFCARQFVPHSNLELRNPFGNNRCKPRTVLDSQ